MAVQPGGLGIEAGSDALAELPCYVLDQVCDGIEAPVQFGFALGLPLLSS